MIIMKPGASEEQISNVVREIEKHGLRADVSRGEFMTVIGPVGDERMLSFDRLAVLDGVKEATMVEIPYKLISREYARFFTTTCQQKVMRVGNIEIGGKGIVFIAGPCAIESRDQLFRIAEGVKQAGAHILRGGVFKPRSSVHSFQGLGATGKDEADEALGWLSEAGREFSIPVITEIIGESQVDLVAQYVDILQI